MSISLEECIKRSVRDGRNLVVVFDAYLDECLPTKVKLLQAMENTGCINVKIYRDKVINNDIIIHVIPFGYKNPISSDDYYYVIYNTRGIWDKNMFTMDSLTFPGPVDRIISLDFYSYILDKDHQIETKEQRNYFENYQKYENDEFIVNMMIVVCNANPNCGIQPQKQLTITCPETYAKFVCDIFGCVDIKVGSKITLKELKQYDFKIIEELTLIK